MSSRGMRSYLHLPSSQLERLLVEAEYALRQFEHYSKTVPGVERLLHEQREEVRRLNTAIAMRRQDDAESARRAARQQGVRGDLERAYRRLLGASGD
jgi:hypothetical protein